MLPGQIGNARCSFKQTFEMNDMELHIPFRRSIFYINNTDQDVIVVHRNNLPISVRKAVDGVIKLKHFVVRVIYKFQNTNEIVETINMINHHQKLNGETNEELCVIKEMLTEAFNNNQTVHSCKIIIDHSLSISTIDKQKICYCSVTDLLFMSKDYHGNVHHPYSSEGLTVQKFKDLGMDAKHSGIVVEIIDNDSKLGKRFMKFGKSYIEIEPREDKTRESGVYITEFKNKDGQFTTNPCVVDASTAQDKFGIYPTLEQAFSEDQVEQLGKQKLLIAQTELERTRSENSIVTEKAKMETETMRLTLQNKEMEMDLLRSNVEATILENKRLLAESDARVKALKIQHEKLADELKSKSMVIEDQFKEKSKRRDDYYDSRSAERKDNSEYIKMGAAGLITGLGVYAAMRKFS